MYFVTRFYGSRQLPLLGVALESLLFVESKAEIVALISDLPSDVERSLRAVFPEVKFIRVPDVKVRVFYSHSERASNKLEDVVSFLETKVPHGSSVFIFDADMMFRSAVSGLVNLDWNLLFTRRARGFPLNAGLVGAKISRPTLEFFSLASRTNSWILRRERRSRIARHKSGGAEQHAYMKILRKELVDLRTTRPENQQITISRSGMRVITVPCALFNSWDPAEISSQTKVVHFKSGWQTLLLDAGGYSTNRPKHLAQPLVDEFQAQLRRVQLRAANEAPLRELLTVPAREV